MATVPVLMYHHINPNRGDMVTVTPEVFDSQMRFLRDSGYRTLTLDELMGVVSGAGPEGRSVAVTFDDGYLDNYVYAFPVLKRYGIKAAIFLVTSWVDGASVSKAGKDALVREFTGDPPLHETTKEYAGQAMFERFSVDWEMAGEMKESGLVEFHSHTSTHRRCDGLERAELESELRASRDRIETVLNTRCDYLCWPKGKYNASSVEAAREAGYRGVFTTEPGVVEPGADPMRIKRIVVKDKVRWFKTRCMVYTSGALSGFYLKMSGKAR